MKNLILIMLLLIFAPFAFACPPGTTQGLQVVQASGATDSEASQNLQEQLAAYRHFPHYQVQRATTRVPSAGSTG